MRNLLFLFILLAFPPIAFAGPTSGNTTTLPLQGHSPDEIVPSAQAYYYTLLGLQYEDEGKASEAVEEYKRALSEDENAPFLLMKIGVMLSQLGNITEAMSFLERANKIEPKNKNTLNLLAGLHITLSDKEAAVALYKEIIALTPETISPYLSLARYLITESDSKGAIDVMESGVSALPSSYQGYYYLAKLYVYERAHDKGIEQYKKAISIFPTFEQAYIDLASLYERLEQIDAAEKVYHQMISSPGMEHKEGGLRLVHLLMQRKAMDEAMGILQRLSEEMPDDPDIWLKISLLLAEKEAYVQAMEALEKVMAKRPHIVDLKVYLASLYEGQEQYDKAITTYHEVLQEDGGRYDAHIRLGFLYFYRLKKMQEALASGEAALKIDSKKPDAYLLTGLVLYESDRFEEASERFSNGVEVAPDRADFHFHLGTTLDKLNRFEAMVGAMEKAIALDSTYAMALNYLGYTYADRGIRLDEAVDLINRALVLRPDDGYYMDSLGWAYYKQGKTGEAMKLLQKAILLVPKDPVILEHLGEVYLKEDHREQAYEVWMLALQLDLKNEKLKARFEEVGFKSPSADR